jgi:hypothetical protein
MAIAALAAAAAIAGAGASIYGTATRDQSGPARQTAIANAQLGDARNNDNFQRMLSILINQRSIAGSTDQYGSTMRYDPATNQWVSSLGAQPKAVQDAADFAAISRNTTDLRQAQAANAAAAQRATQAAPVADTAIRNLQNFKEMPSSALVGLLDQRAADAANTTFRPLVADTLRQYQRTGSAAGPVLADLGRQQFESLRDSMADAQIKGLTGVDQINQARRGGLEQAATTAYGLSTPQFQYPGITPSSNRDTMAGLVAARAQQGGTAPAYGMGGVNTAAGQSQAAYKNVQGTAGIVPTSTMSDIGKEIGNTLSNKDLISNMTKGYNYFFPGSGTTPTAPAGYNASGGGFGYTPPSNDEIAKAWS